MNEFIKKSNEAIRHYDDVEAKKLIKELKNFLASQDIQKNDPALFQELQKLLVHLRIVAIPQLSDKEASEVFRNNYLDSYDIEIDMENRLTVSLFSLPEIPRDTLREKFRKALSENNQQLGNLTVSQWISAFEKEYPIQTRNISAPVDFVITNQEAKKINPLLRERLKELLHVYDYMLITTLPATGSELTRILNSDLPENENFQNTPPSYTNYNNLNALENITSKNQGEHIRIEQLSLSDALKKFPEIGEQLITSMRIKLKNFPEPVRPSINNWLSDYTFNLGFESHSAMDRGTYLFRNENAKILNLTDREKISFLLKAYDENSLIDVNVNTKQIVFPKHETSTFNGGSTSKREVEPPREFHNQTPQRNIQEVYNFQKQEIKQNDIFKEERAATENRNAGNINFSSPQKLPYEKQVIQPQSIQQSQKPTPSPQPMHISSQNLRNSNVPPGNIVNLKK
ncbi:MAG: hypothetical protein US30_C0005G0029 [Candidatus Moranbacteria bacterium GW2011_GWF2_36_839]|nr:MAG: hypothetical protein US27_C0005G0025 [Candidatus Moranbacteria bacterium GW2011_GWF1_36_78]KKQ17216.1 MAG: hypothetical protein US30_C0005G0029 [Candidatus Moranbacteria bacterium GW2011_GWF2_36_839]HAT73734.1 hypothetical protein [Candidatus Moranbacteria bacterium]HBY11277.1 hypothetical protein [Candidatus Moranbacteria bacterium]